MRRKETLQEALTGRDEEIENYQLNIDNYRLAIAKIAAEHAGSSEMDMAMREFSAHLDALLKSSLIEQRKAQIIRDVIAAQLEN